MNEILEHLSNEEQIVEELINIDNDIMNTKYSFNDYYNAIESRFNIDIEQIDIKENTVFVTEGDVILTLDILRRFNTAKKIVIFVNQSYLGMNKWLMSKYYEITGNNNIILDEAVNYNKYIDKGFKVIPLGEEGLIEQVMEDFYDKV